VWLSDTSVKRPVFATVLSMMLLAFGALSFQDLAIREYPNIVPPIVSVQTSYPGASADVVETRISQVLEGELSGIEGIKAIRSASRDQSSNISIEFTLDRDLDEASNDVRDSISRVSNRLPLDVEPPRITKQDADARPAMYLTLMSTSLSGMELTDYMQRYLVDRFAVIPGVSQVTVFGGGGPAMRIWLDRMALAARGLTVNDIEGALRRENLELPAGRIESELRDFQVRIARNYQTVDAFRQLVIAQGEDGHLVRLGEVATVELGPRNQRSQYRTNGASTTGFGVVKQSTANTVEVLGAVTAEMERVNQDLPEDMELIPSGDDSVYISAAINAVFWTIGITTALVGLVILVFLGSLRAMLIPLLTIPICLVSVFTILAAFGFSINLVTLLALVLSIGLVVDDSIVVLENAHRRIEEGEPPLVAAYNGTRQVAFAVIATTAVLVAAFAPIAFLQDNIGRIFAELAVTVSAAVIFSSVLALSLAPMLCSKLLRSSKRESRATHWLDGAFARLSAAYGRALDASLRLPWVSVLASLGVGLWAYSLLSTIPQEYAPSEDQGSFMAMIQAPEGVGFKHLSEQALRVEAEMQPFVESGDITRGSVGVPGFGGASGIAMVTLRPWDDREVSTAELMQRLNTRWAEIPDLRIIAFMRSGISRSGGGQPVQIVLGGPTYEELAQWRDLILDRAAENPGLTRLDSDLKETQPQLDVNVDTDRAAVLGVSVQSIGQALQTMMGERTITTYVVDGEEYDVVVQAKDEQRTSQADLRNTFVRSERTRELIPLSNLVTLEDTAGPSSLNRYNRLRAVTISANLTPGYTLGEALEYFEGIIREELPENAQIDYKGESLEYREASGSLLVTLGMALLVVFLVLAAQFESFVHPIVILVTVPLAIAGGLLGLSVAGMTFNIYSQIGVVMLIGIAAKNGVLIVEFINQLRDQGVEFRDAILEAAQIRFRPIVMTTVSTVMGSIPLMLATGPGASSRTTLGVVIFGGVSLATILTLFVVPSFYYLMARHTGSPNAVARRLASLATNASS